MTREMMSGVRREVRVTSPSCFRAVLCLVCGGCFELDSAAVVLFETDEGGEEQKSGDICWKCLSLTSAQVREQLLERALEKVNDAAWLESLATEGLPLPALTEVQAIQAECESKFRANV